MSQPCWHCDYRPEPSTPPPTDCWNTFLTDTELAAHLDRWHPSRRHWDDPSHGAGRVLTLGFTREELDAIEQRSWPSSVETWIHERVTEVLTPTADSKEQPMPDLDTRILDPVRAHALHEAVAMLPNLTIQSSAYKIDIDVPVERVIANAKAFEVYLAGTDG